MDRFELGYSFGKSAGASEQRYQHLINEERLTTALIRGDGCVFGMKARIVFDDPDDAVTAERIVQSLLAKDDK